MTELETEAQKRFRSERIIYSFSPESEAILTAIDTLYLGNNHTEVQRILLDNTGRLNKSLEYLCAMFNDMRPQYQSEIAHDLMTMEIRILAEIMKRYDWDGVSISEHPPFNETTEGQLVRSTIADTLMGVSYDIPRKIIESATRFLDCPDRFIVLAALIYISSWYSGGNRNTSLFLQGFLREPYSFPVDNEAVKTLLERIHNHMGKV